MHYSYGLSVVTSHLTCGGKLCLINDSITSSSFWSKIGVSGSHLPGVPFHYIALARLGLGLVPPSVKTFTQAGGALDLRIQTKMRDWAEQRGSQFFVMYGQTEAAPRMATLQHADHARKAGSVGVALAGGQFSILDDHGAPLPADAVGTVVYEGPNVMMGYATSRADLGAGDEMNGRLETGDLGRLDYDGFLYLTGRTKRFAKIAGYRLGLDEIEERAVRRLPGRLSRPRRKNRRRPRAGIGNSAQGPRPRACRQFTRCPPRASPCARSSKSRARRAARSTMRG